MRTRKEQNKILIERTFESIDNYQNLEDKDKGRLKELARIMGHIVSNTESQWYWGHLATLAAIYCLREESSTSVSTNPFLSNLGNSDELAVINDRLFDSIEKTSAFLRMSPLIRDGARCATLNALKICESNNQSPWHTIRDIAEEVWSEIEKLNFLDEPTKDPVFKECFKGCSEELERRLDDEMSSMAKTCRTKEEIIKKLQGKFLAGEFWDEKERIEYEEYSNDVLVAKKKIICALEGFGNHEELFEAHKKYGGDVSKTLAKVLEEQIEIKDTWGGHE